MATLGVDVAADTGLLEDQMRWDMRVNDWIHLIKHNPPGWREESQSALNVLESAGGRTRPGWAGFRHLAASTDLGDRRKRDIVINAARDLQVLSPYMTRTLRADVDESRPTREAITRVVEFSLEEAALYNKVYEICLARASREGIPPGFVTQMPERRTASCVPAVASEILAYQAEDEDDESGNSFTAEEVRALAPFAEAALQSQDQKLEALYQIVDRAFGDLEADRVMIFSTFRGTLHYLRRKLEEAWLFPRVDVWADSGQRRGLSPGREEQGKDSDRVSAGEVSDPAGQRGGRRRIGLRALPRCSEL